MRINKPAYDISAVFPEILKGTTDPVCLKLLASDSSLFSQSETNYGILGATSELHKFPSGNGSHKLSKDQMTGFYKLFYKKSTPLRLIYDAIKNSAPNDLCPYCEHRRVKTLDHFLSKSKYPPLSFLALNLVPCCSDCNKDKGNKIVSSRDKCFLHPYFEHVNAQWLVAKIRHVDPIVVIYSVDSGISSTLYKRILWQFSELNLANLYSSEAADHLSSMSRELSRLHQNGGKKQVSASLEEQASDSAAWKVNHWKTALLIAASKDDWFCDGGFKNLK